MRVSKGGVQTGVEFREARVFENRGGGQVVSERVSRKEKAVGLTPWFCL